MMAYWSQHLSSEMDDIFDDEAEESLIAQKEWTRAEYDIRKTGYRLGLDAGEQEALQEGFDAGYKETSLIAFAAGRLQGLISGNLGMISHQNLQAEEVDFKTKVWSELLEDCSVFIQIISQVQQQHSTNFADVCISRTPCEMCGPSQTSTAGSNKCETTDSVNDIGELTANLRALDLQELPPMHDHKLRTELISLWERYHLMNK